MRRIPALVLAAAVALVTGAAAAASAPAAAPTVLQVYKSATCGCCKAWVERMREAGFEVRVTDLEDAALQERKARLGVGPRLASCHTAVVNGYVVEGHVPAADIRRLLAQKPAVAGIAAPGMPVGSPGMESPDGQRDRYDVVSFTRDGTVRTFARH